LAQLLLDGGSQQYASSGLITITGHTIVGNTATVNTQAAVHSVSGGNYRIEVSIVDQSANTTSVGAHNFSATPGKDLTLDFAPAYPLNGGSGTYTIYAQLFYFDASGFPVQQDIATMQFLHTQNVGPTFADTDGVSVTDARIL
jgi:hypothetical protein